MRWQSVVRSDLGLRRRSNEDSTSADDELGLYIVCDGMGGHRGGEVASATACRVTEREILRHRSLIEEIQSGQRPAREAVDIARQALEAANRQVFELAQSPGLSGMGTTLTLLLFLGRKGVLAHVGDTRIYLLRRDALHLMTSDHTGVAELVRARTVTEQQAKKMPIAHLLTRAVGIQPAVEVDTLLFDVLPADRFLLCSDGLTEYVFERSELKQFLQGAFSEIAKSLVDKANAAGGKDNISAIVVRAEIEDDGETLIDIHSDLHLKVVAIAGAFGFDDLHLRTIQRLLNISRARELDPREVFCAQGETVDRILIVLEGELELRVDDKKVGQVDSHEFIGRRYLFEASPAKATVMATQPTRALEIERSAFWQFVRRHPVTGVRILSRVAWKTQKKLDRAMTEPEEHMHPNELF